MARRLFDFKCSNGHKTERLVDSEAPESICFCGANSARQVSVLTLPKGVLGPNWAADRAKKQAKQQNS